MDHLNKSIRKLQNQITHSNKLVISLGKFLECQQILDVSFDESTIFNFITMIKKDKAITSINNKIYRCYKYRNMEYRITDKKHNNYKSDIIDSNNINLDEGDVRVKLLNFQQHIMEDFHIHNNDSKSQSIYWAELWLAK